MAKSKDLTTKELKAELKKANKALEIVRADNARLRKIAIEVEPALAAANKQVEELQISVNYLKPKVKMLEDEVKCLHEESDEANDKASEEKYEKIATVEDFAYEKKRRTSAENKLYDLEQRLFDISTENYGTTEIRSNMVGIRIDRNGKIA